ncbi:MAG: ABC transporter ATP-binding protein, partial [Clostridia bacterium]|nr:ABC transporter ATP-binding protein [Clostridia bacterium]
MNNKEANRLSRRDAVKYNLRAFQTIYATRKKVLALRMSKLAFAALTPYLGIRLSALLLDELAGARDPHRLTALVLWIIGSAAVITLVQSLLDRWHDAEQAGMYIHISHLMSDKMRRMDFVDIDSPKTHALLSTIAQNQNGGGWGMHRVTHNFNNLWMAILQLGGGIAMTVSLFTSRVPDSADKYTVLNSPFITVAVIALMLAVTYLAPMLSAYGGKLFAQHAGDHNLGNRLFGFYGWLGKREESAVDVRVYDLSGFCETYCLDKTATFSSKGPFAKIAKTKTGFLDAGSTVVG